MEKSRQMPISEMDLLRPIKEFFALLPYTEKTVRRFVSQGRIPTHAINGRRYATRREIDAFLSNLINQ